MKSNFTFKIFKNFEKELKENWKDLENNGDFYFFQKYAYIQNLIETFNINSFFIAVIYDNNISIAVFPLEIKIFKKNKNLQWLGTAQSDYCCKYWNN